jgi:ribosomal protein L18
MNQHADFKRVIRDTGKYIYIYMRKKTEIVICSSYLKKPNRQGKRKKGKKKFATDLGSIIGKRRKKKKRASAWQRKDADISCFPSSPPKSSVFL